MTQLRSPLMEQSPAPRSAGTVYRSRPHDVRNLHVSLKQWRIFHAVIDCGGFAEAAKFLHLSQSAISYTVAKLQEQLGIQLLKIEGRKAHLTAAGRAMLERSRHVLKEAIELELFARNVGQGWGSEVRLVVDQNTPAPLLMDALRQFDQLGAGAHVRLSEVAMPRAEEVLRDMTVDLVVSARVPLGFLGEPLVEVEYLAVAHPEHALFKLGRDAMFSDLEKHVHIGVGYSGESPLGIADNGMHGRRWHLSSYDAVVEAVCWRFGYAWLPKHRIRKLLDEGVLAPLLPGERGTYKTVLYLIHGRHWSAGPAAARLAEILRTAAAESGAD
ncbi:MAG: LysR family transcriptional regulator [Noviherbaspirillum sp.]|nr:LysR family transcriptional regulator [Noviherbaspirillum sp.]